MANFDQSLAIFFLFSISWCVISVNYGKFYQIHTETNIYTTLEGKKDFWPKFGQKMCEKAFWAHIAQ